jgi:hypothetical protein
MWIILAALAKSLAASLGGDAGSLLTQLIDTGETAWTDKEAWSAWAGPWILWCNAVNDAGREFTDAEKQAARDVAAAVHANNQSLASGGAPVPLPSPPTA